MAPSAVEYLIVSLIIGAVYELNRVTDMREDSLNCHDEYVEATREKPLLLCLSIVCAFAAVVLCLIFQTRGALVLVLAVLVVGFCYSVPVFPQPMRLRLKSRFPQKTISVSAGWTALTVAYPAIQTSSPVTFGLALSCFMMLSGAVGIQIVCDLRDLSGDRACDIETLPVLLGAPRTMRLLRYLNATVAVAVVAFWVAGVLPFAGLVILLHMAFYACLLRYTSVGFWQRRSTAPLIIGVQVFLLLFQGLVIRYFGLCSGHVS